MLSRDAGRPGCTSPISHTLSQREVGDLRRISGDGASDGPHLVRKALNEKSQQRKEEFGYDYRIVHLTDRAGTSGSGRVICDDMVKR